MQGFTAQRNPQSADEFWVLEHDPVFTLGQAGRREHLLHPGEIPVIPCDRGGQVTYHGPGQLVVYVLFDLRRAGLGVRLLVQRLEQAVIDCLAELQLQGHTRPGAPGVYVDQAKIAALGLRVRHGCCYHGLALNVAMDLTPFSRINPCGYPDLKVTQLRDQGCHLPMESVAERLIPHLQAQLAAPARQIRLTESAR